MVHIEEVRDAQPTNKNTTQRPFPIDDIETPYAQRVNENVFEENDMDDPSPLPIHINRKKFPKKTSREEYAKFAAITCVIGLTTILAFAPIENLNKPVFLKKILRKIVPYQSLLKWSVLGMLSSVILI